MSKLPCNQRLDMSVDRGRILPLGGASSGNAGFTSCNNKTVDTPNAYKHFSRRTAREPSKKNDSELTPRNGALSATGELSFRHGKRPMGHSPSGELSYMNEEALTPRGGLRMTGMEKRIVDLRTFNEDNPRKLVKKAEAPVRNVMDASGRDPFITGNGMIGRLGVSPAKGRKNAGTTQPDMDTRNSIRRSQQDESGVVAQRYSSPYRAVAHDRAKSPTAPESLPFHPEVNQSGLAKVQRFAFGAMRHQPSLTGVFTPQERKAPPPYKLVAPFHTTE